VVQFSTPEQLSKHLAERLRELIELARKADFRRTTYLLVMAQAEVRKEARDRA
jgi:hypothetical protein